MTDTENLPDRKYQDLYEDYQILSEEYQVLSNVCRDIYDDYQLLSEEYQNLDDEYQDLYDNYAICRSGAELDNEKKLKEQIAGLKKEISELKDQVEDLEETCCIGGGRISDLEYLIGALRTQIRQYSERYSKIQRLVMPFAAYCSQNSENDRPEIDRLICAFKDSMTKILAETMMLIQSLSRYNELHKPISD